jgi:hypothetical protein
VQVVWTQCRVLGTAGGEVMGSGLFGCAETEHLGCILNYWVL